MRPSRRSQFPPQWLVGEIKSAGGVKAEPWWGRGVVWEPRLQGGAREGSQKAMALLLLRETCRYPEQPCTPALGLPAVKAGLSDLKGLFQSN